MAINEHDLHLISICISFLRKPTFWCACGAVYVKSRSLGFVPNTCTGARNQMPISENGRTTGITPTSCTCVPPSWRFDGLPKQPLRAILALPALQVYPTG